MNKNSDPLNLSYQGNPNIKKGGVQEEWTLERIEEYKKCSEDPLYFIQNHVKIVTENGLVIFEPFEYQKKMLENFNNERYSICLLPRQSGKTTIVAAYLLWYAMFNPEKTVAILANKGETAREILSRVQLALENIPFFLQPGMKSYNKGNIDFANNSRIVARASSSSSIRGMSVSVLYIDEAGFLENAEEFYQSVYPVITAGRNTKVIITSTPNGTGNLFHRLWMGASTGTNNFKPFRAYWWDVPGRDEQWKKETIKNTSERQFQQEFEGCIGFDSVVTIRDRLTGDVFQMKAEQAKELLVSNNKNRMNISKNTNNRYEILTPLGFQCFDGISEKETNVIYDIKTSHGKQIFATGNHLFLAHDGGWISVEDMKVGETNLKESGIVSSVIGKIGGPFKVYDFLNVGGKENGSRQFIANGLIVHNSFLGSSNTLIDGNTLLFLSAQEPIHSLEGDTVKIYKKPEKDHDYVMTVDVSKGRGQDYSTFNVIDISKKPFEQVCVFRDNTISPLIFPHKIKKFADIYNEAYVLVESNDNGIVVSNGLFYDLEYDNQFAEMRHGKHHVGVEMNKKIKSIGCSNLKDLIEEHRLVIHDKETIQEICTFVSKGKSFEADAGNHDDLVMNLVLFSWFSGDNHFKMLTDIELKTELYEKKIQEMEDELLPFGVVDDGIRDPITDAAIYETFGGINWQRIG